MRSSTVERCTVLNFPVEDVDLAGVHNLSPESDSRSSEIISIFRRNRWPLAIERRSGSLMDKMDLLQSDRRLLRSQNIFLNLAGRSFG